MRNRTKTSEKFRRYIRAVSHFTGEIDRLAACFVVQKRTGIKWEDWSEEDRRQLNEARRLFGEAKKLWSAVWAKRIGDQILREEGP
jgi:hypothetical protein